MKSKAQKRKSNRNEETFWHWTILTFIKKPVGYRSALLGG
jgi:hypothetical protein